MTIVSRRSDFSSTAAELALNNGIAGSLEGPSSYLMKSPPRQIADDDAYELVEEFIERNRRGVRQGLEV